jgi:hypothetical protein
MTCYNEAVVIYKGRDNAVTVIPYADLTADVNYDMTAVTRVLTNADVEGDETVGNSVIGDSDFDALLVYWNDDTIVGSTPQWRIYCKVGLYANGTIPAGTYTLRITIFDPTHPNGLVLPDTESALLVTIVDLP